VRNDVKDMPHSILSNQSLMTGCFNTTNYKNLSNSNFIR